MSTLADLIDDWHGHVPGSPLRLARALSLTGPVLDRYAIYTGEYHASDRLAIRWDASDVAAEMEIGEDSDGVVTGRAARLEPEDAVSRRWGIPLARDVVVPGGNEMISTSQDGTPDSLDCSPTPSVAEAPEPIT